MRAKQSLRLMLGTVQFGMNYGIANKTGQPSYDQVRDILACAVEGGVNGLDTAAQYGQSEEMLGCAMAELSLIGKLTVVTKIMPLAGDLSPDRAYGLIEKSVRTSLQRLRLKCLPFCLFHREENALYEEGLWSLKDKGLVRRIGVSVMTPEVALNILRAGWAEAIQIPANLLDHRFERTGVLAEAKAKGVTIFVRSIYMQGLLLLPDTEIPLGLVDIIPVRRQLQALADEVGMSLRELAVRYALSLSNAQYVLVGVETLPQMQENLKLFSKAPLDAALVQAIANIVPDLPNRILMPTYWRPKI